MARTTAPFMSMDASGTLGKTLTASRWKGRSYMRLRVIPANPKTAMQVAFRAMMKFLGQTWSGLTDMDKVTWNNQAGANNYSPFNAFVSTNQKRWGSFLSPSQQSPADLTGTAATLATPVGVGGVRMATVTIATTAAADGWGLYVYRTPGGAPAGTQDEVIAVLEMDGTSTVFVDSPLEPGAYQYKVRGFAKSGKQGTLTASSGAVTVT